MNEVALLIPHYNNPSGLIKSIASICDTEKIDVIIVDDGSQIQKLDQKQVDAVFKAFGTIFYLYLERNYGIEHALNFGLDFILERKQYKFIGRLDCGDICLTNRFEQQVNFLKENPKVKLVGSNAIATDLNSNFLYKTIFPKCSKEIKKRMYLNAMFLHPTVIFSSDIIRTIGKYPIDHEAAEDYAFFFKIVRNFKTANLPVFLVQYEINPCGISVTKRKIQVKSRINIIRDNFYLGFWPIYGLIRNYLLLFLPYSIIQKIKRYK